MSEQQIVNLCVKAIKVANALHAHGVTSAQADTFDHGQWVMAGAGARVKSPPDTSRPVIIALLREFEEAGAQAVTATALARQMQSTASAMTALEQATRC